jgi:DNA-binding response OmpR family regulator
MSPKKKILVIEDDPNMGFLLTEYLSSNGFAITLCKDGDSGLTAFNSSTFDFCIIDIMLPGIDGFTLTERIKKQQPNIPVVFLTARSLKRDKLKGFNLGADDFITKPFDEDELLCRIHAILNRYANTPNVTPKTEIETCQIGLFTFDPQNQSLTLQSQQQRLTFRECNVLQMLCENKNKIVRRSDLLLKYWDKDDYFNGRSLDVFITRLRKRLAADAAIRIENIPKVGFVLHDGDTDVE